MNLIFQIYFNLHEHGSNLYEPSLHLHAYWNVGWVVSTHSPSPQEFGGHIWVCISFNKITLNNKIIKKIDIKNECIYYYHK